tara:strand:- start:1081 stop:1629 length:549 start_codon:yes stop_codon:yes gene_type:complete
MKKILNIVLLSSMIFLIGALRTNAQSNKKYKKISAKKVVYVNKSPNVSAVRYLPKATKKITYKKTNYNFYNGRFYKTVQGNHIVVSPPKGLRIKVLPVGFISFIVGSTRYYHYEGIYYTYLAGIDEYEVVNAPIGSLIKDLPNDIEVVVYKGKVYYEYHNVLYKKVEMQDGDAYEVVGQLEE